ncbi:MAG: clostripain-related cysteine peptidase [bacterium]
MLEPKRVLTFCVLGVLLGLLLGALLGACGGGGTGLGTPCDPDPCSGHGTCDASGDDGVCACDPGYAGDACEGCDDGYQDHDGDGDCAPGCETVDLDCPLHMSCDDSSGEAGCVCDPGYAGQTCEACDDGYQDHDGDGGCRADCATAAYDCSGHGACDDSSGEPLCLCDLGYEPDGQGRCELVDTDGTCGAPFLLDLTAGTVLGSNTDASDNHVGSCASSTAAGEIVYVFELDSARRVTFESEGFDTVLHLRSACGDPASELDCDDDDGPGRGSRIVVDLDAGTYYLFVDGYNEEGDYTLTVAAECQPGLVEDPGTGHCIDDPCDPNPCAGSNRHQCTPVLPAGFQCDCDPGHAPDPGDPTACVVDPGATGETCADPVALPVVANGLLSGSTTAAVDDGESSCGGEGPDHIYAFTLTETTQVFFQMTGFDTVLHLRSDCGDPDAQVACTDDDGPDHDSSLHATLDPGTYFLFADSYSDGGDYELRYRFHGNPCADDDLVCPGAPLCEPYADWSAHDCVCPAGQLPQGGSCVADPCDPNPCNGPNRNRCVPDLPGARHCECNQGYVDDAGNPGSCIPDPGAPEWTVLIFLNADNNLEEDAYGDASEIEAATSATAVQVVALWDEYKANGGTARVFEFDQGGRTQVADWGELDLSDWRVLRDFGVWAVQAYPARHYLFIAWDHGSGWKSALQEPLFRSFSNDDNGAAQRIDVSNGDYARALAAITSAVGRKLDIFGFDACQMGMWEVAEATVPFADYLVASEANIPGSGWEYDGFLGPLVADPAMPALTLGETIVQSYYDGSWGNRTLALTDLATMGALATAITAFANQLRANPSLFTDFETLRLDTQSWGTNTHRDLYRFTEQVAALSAAPQPLVDAASALLAQLALTIVYNRAQADQPGSNGLAVYFPEHQTSVDTQYDDAGAVWCDHTTWDEFLADFTN